MHRLAMNRALILLVAVGAACSLTNNSTPSVRPEPTPQAAAAPAQAVAPAAPAPGTPAGCGGSCNGGCAAHRAETAQPGVARQLGAPITITENTALSDVITNPSRFSGQTIRTEGTVSAVCQAAGCWMRLVDSNNQQIHVRMHGHSFFIPRNATGRRVVVQATVLGGVANGHCEQEANGQTGQRARLELDALGVQLEG